MYVCEHTYMSLSMCMQMALYLRNMGRLFKWREKSVGASRLDPLHIGRHLQNDTLNLRQLLRIIETKFSG